MLVMTLHRPRAYVPILRSVATPAPLAFLTFESVIFKKNALGTVSSGGRTGWSSQVSCVRAVAMNHSHLVLDFGKV